MNALTAIGAFMAFDFETQKFRPGLQAPRPVCLSMDDGNGALLVPTPEAREIFIALLESDLPLVGHNVAYDMACALAWWGCTDLVFKAYEQNRVLDTQLLEFIAEIEGATEHGGAATSLDDLYRIHGLGELPKDHDVRTSYGDLLDRPLAAYTKAQIEYALNDAKATRAVFARQAKRWGASIEIEDLAFLARRQFALHLTRNYGLRVDPTRLDMLRRACTDEVARLRAIALENKLIRADGTRDMKAIRAMVTTAYSDAPPMTKAQKNRKSEKPFVPQVSTSRVTLAESDLPVLQELAELGQWAALENKDLPLLEQGARAPIHTRYWMARTLRSTSSGPNVQNFRRNDFELDGESFSVRECFVPRAGHVFIDADYSGLELATFAQVCYWTLGRRTMLDKINACIDLHSDIAQDILGTTYEDVRARIKQGDKVAKNARSCAKVVNFGRQGGMGAPTLVQYAKQGYGITMTEEFARHLIDIWNRRNPDGLAYLQYVGRLPESTKGFNVRIPRTSITRRGAPYCAAANTPFQALGAIVGSQAAWDLQREIFCDQDSPLRNVRLVNFIHDEFLAECPEGEHSAALDRLIEVMLTSARKHLPDVSIDAEGVVMRRWGKGATSTRNKEGEWSIWG